MSRTCQHDDEWHITQKLKKKPQIDESIFQENRLRTHLFRNIKHIKNPCISHVYRYIHTHIHTYICKNSEKILKKHHVVHCVWYTVLFLDLENILFKWLCSKTWNFLAQITWALLLFTLPSFFSSQKRLPWEIQINKISSCTNTIHSVRLLWLPKEYLTFSECKWLKRNHHTKVIGELFKAVWHLFKGDRERNEKTMLW